MTTPASGVASGEPYLKSISDTGPRFSLSTCWPAGCFRHPFPVPPTLVACTSPCGCGNSDAWYNGSARDHTTSRDTPPALSNMDRLPPVPTGTISLHNQGSSYHMHMCIRAIQPHLLQTGSAASPCATLGRSLILTNRLAAATHHCVCHHITRPTCIYTCSHCMHATQLACALATWGRLSVTGRSLVLHQTLTLAPTTCMHATFHAAQRALAQPEMLTPHWPAPDSRTTIPTTGYLQPTYQRLTYMHIHTIQLWTRCP